MCGDYWVVSREPLISMYEELLIKTALQQGYNVIVDATNLNPKTIQKWKDLAKEYNCDIQFKEFIIPYTEAIKRDKNRNLVVGEETIRTFYRKYYPDVLKTELDEIS